MNIIPEDNCPFRLYEDPHNRRYDTRMVFLLIDDTAAYLSKSTLIPNSKIVYVELPFVEVRPHWVQSLLIA